MDFDDLGDIGKTLTYLLPAIIIILTNVVFRKQREQKARLSVIRSLLSEIEYNRKLIDSFSTRWQTKKFKTATWKRNKDKMDYIDSGLRYNLAEAYEIAEEFNRDIDAAKKYRSTSYLAAIQVNRLTKPLENSRQGLEEWLQLNQSKKKLPAVAK